ncbi:hypothetical protein Ppa06_64480 [Planomonospora parontospora subsp. parontospora]|uniref:Uncharacterized protein n=2 Tax=Planomonospora parontospora TaxID=58119 RepID=A0AA37BN31_9ACTN|nr:hypothetical protein [Planomonospora parontospora]GGK94189.1 hypothetical protein GCM10010126_61940 [Planomonospora parontospora]GII12650.1 hypothetical protein Ppa06_64480 [Planomonospora parontospora subsp. parontospora]
MSGTTQVVARVAEGTRKRLRTLLDAEKNRHGDLLTGMDPPPDADAFQRAEVRTWARQRLERLRAVGDLLDTVDAALAHGIRVELAERGWDRDWPPVPASAPSSGRWPGSRQAGWPEKIAARIPAELAARVQAGCWHTSAEPIAALRAWRAAHPGPLSDSELLAHYERLAAEITPPGVIWRAGLENVLPPS